MGNAESAQVYQISGLKRTQESDNNAVYDLVNLKGGGSLIQLMKEAGKTGETEALDRAIQTDVGKFLYGGGKGKLVPVSEVVKMRNQERNAMLGALQRKKGKGKSGPNILDNVDQEAVTGDMIKALKMLDGGGKGGKGGSKYREFCWDIGQRGAIGETVLHVCFLQGTTIHNELAKRLVYYFPKLINDICISEDYYGNSPLHQAIVNEDPEMVRFLLMQSADVHQRCFGAFFCPDDQRSSRTDSMEHEWVDVSLKSNYAGRTYWGEYPLSFAACTNQMDCVRLLRAKKADPNRQDTNGNTVLHLMVIHENAAMFDFIHSVGGRLHTRNNQNLSPLTLAAALAKGSMFGHVLQKERDILWTYGEIVCAAYPLKYIDTIEEGSGKLNSISALGLIIYGETPEHLELLDGLMEDLLQEKWNAFAKRRLIHNFVGFCAYFLCFFVAMLLRHRELDSSDEERLKETTFTKALWNMLDGKNETSIWDWDWLQVELLKGSYYNRTRACHLSRVAEGAEVKDAVRLTAEAITVLGVVGYLASAILQGRRIGWSEYYNILREFPAKFLFHVSFLFVLGMIPLRVFCYENTEHVVGILAILSTSVHFLYFCRGIRFVGPFVLMLYKIVSGDLARFFIIYMVLIVGFSQSFFVVFKSCESRKVCRVGAGGGGWGWGSWWGGAERRWEVHSDGANVTEASVVEEMMLKLEGRNSSCIWVTKEDVVGGQKLNTLQNTFTLAEEAEKHKYVAGGVRKPNHPNILYSAAEALARMFIMSLGEFSVFYRELQGCRLAWMAKLLFLVFELLVSILMINLLIAMMARTYQAIKETQKEWKRQWAKVILMIERSLEPEERLLAQLKYSRPIGTNPRSRAFVVQYKRKEGEAEAKRKRDQVQRKELEEAQRALRQRKEPLTSSRAPSRVATAFPPLNLPNTNPY